MLRRFPRVMVLPFRLRKKAESEKGPNRGMKSTACGSKAVGGSGVGRPGVELSIARNRFKGKGGQDEQVVITVVDGEGLAVGRFLYLSQVDAPTDRA